MEIQGQQNVSANSMSI